MDAQRRPDLADPDFDPIPSPPVRLRDFDPLIYQRLVVNPFLAVLALILWWHSTRWFLFRGPFPPLMLATVPFLAFLPRAIQYHCLDCGRTGSYPYRDRHDCPAIRSRWSDRSWSRSWIPSARTQLVVWAYLIGSAALLWAVAG